jgi:psiF repeat-containing protein
MTMKLAFAAAALVSMLTCGFAQAQAPTATKPAAAAGEKAKPAAAKPRTAKSLECSKEADAKNVHGKERKTFMSTCKKG